MEKTLKEELEQLKQELGTSAFDEHLDRMKGLYTSDADKALINEYVMQMLEKEPEHRPADWKEVIVPLEAVDPADIRMIRLGMNTDGDVTYWVRNMRILFLK